MFLYDLPVYVYLDFSIFVSAVDCVFECVQKVNLNESNYECLSIENY